MKAPTCVLCHRTVLELRGQYALLDSFYLDDAPSLEASAGDWHLHCLHTSPHREAWCDLRLRNHLHVRHYEPIKDVGAWTVIRHPRTREVLAFSREGDLLRLTFRAPRLQRVKGGAIYGERYNEFHLELEDTELIGSIQQGLAAAKTFSLLSLCELLQIGDRVVHPEALEGGHLHWSRGLERMWTRRSVSARCEYGVFVPEELEPFVSHQNVSN